MLENRKKRIKKRGEKEGRERRMGKGIGGRKDMEIYLTREYYDVFVAVFDLYGYNNCFYYIAYI